MGSENGRYQPRGFETTNKLFEERRLEEEEGLSLSDLIIISPAVFLGIGTVIELIRENPEKAQFILHAITGQ